MSSILGALQLPPHATNYSSGTNNSTTFDDVSEVDLSAVATTTGSASVSLSSDLTGVTAGTPTGQFALSFAHALESATYVDQTTGQREIQSGKAGELAASLNALFQQYGLSADQASQVTQSLTSELANGQPINLSSSFDNVSSSSVSASGTYGSSAVWTANSVTQTERSGSIKISVDASGQLSVALNSKTVSTAQYTGEVKGTGSPNGLMVVVDLPGADGTTGSVALTSGELGVSGSNSGTPAFTGFGQANNAALAALTQSMSALMPGLTAPSANSPLKETENDQAVAASQVAAMLVTTHIGSSGNAGAGGSDGTGAGGNQSQSSSASDSSGVGSGGDAGSGDDSVLSQLLSANKTVEDSLAQLLDSLSKTTLLGSKDTQKRLKDLLDYASQALDPNSATTGSGTAGSADSNGSTGAAGSADSAGSATGADGTSSSGGLSLAAGESFSLEISFTQTIALQVVDMNGYGSTLYARPDGSVGKMVTQPTYVTA